MQATMRFRALRQAHGPQAQKWVLPPPWRAFVRHGHKPALCAVLAFFIWHPTLIAHAVHIEHINSCGMLFFTKRMLLRDNYNQEKRIHQYYAQSNKKHNTICHLSVFV